MNKKLNKQKKIKDESSDEEDKYNDDTIGMIEAMKERQKEL